MPIRRFLSAVAAALLLATGAPAFADGGDWSGRFWGLGWGDGYHAPPRSGALHFGGSHHHAGSHHHPGSHLRAERPNYFGDAGPLMPGGYPYRSYVETVDPAPSSTLPKWLWDPSQSEVVVEEIDLAAPPAAQASDPVPPPPLSKARSGDPSLGLPPTLEPTDGTDPRAMNRRGRVQATNRGWSR